MGSSCGRTRARHDPKEFTPKEWQAIPHKVRKQMPGYGGAGGEARRRGGSWPRVRCARCCSPACRGGPARLSPRARGGPCAPCCAARRHGAAFHALPWVFPWSSLDFDDVLSMLGKMDTGDTDADSSDSESAVQSRGRCHSSCWQ